MLRKDTIPQVIITTFAIIWILPMIWMAVLALTPNSLVQENSARLIPVAPTLQNFISVFTSGLTPRWLFNSLVVTGITTVLVVIFQSMAAYAISFISFHGKGLIYPLMLAGLMIPREAMFIPLFLLFAKWQAHNTYLALILPRIAIPLGIFLLTQFMKGIPREIEEAGQIDGASRWQSFWCIILPMSGPSLTALAVFTLIHSWNDYLWPLVSATKKEMFTITTGLASLQGNFAQARELASLMARGVIASLPLIIFFIVFQQHLIRGISITSGGK